jgi:hypothetical protein
LPVNNHRSVVTNVADDGRVSVAAMTSTLRAPAARQEARLS